MKGSVPLRVRIGNTIRERRQAKGFSQEGFADEIGMHRAQYGLMERGRRDVQLSTLERVCEGLDVPMWEVIRDAETS